VSTPLIVPFLPLVTPTPGFTGSRTAWENPENEKRTRDKPSKPVVKKAETFFMMIMV
jgi:hypothetical protein